MNAKMMGIWAAVALTLPTFAAPKDAAAEKDKADVKALCSKVWDCAKAKKGAEAVEAAEKAVAIAQRHPKDWGLNQDAYGALGKAYLTNKDYPKSVDAYLEQCKYHNPHFGLEYGGFDPIVETMRADKCAEARAMLERVRKLTCISEKTLMTALDVEARTYKVEKRWDDVLKLYDRAFADTNFVAKVHAARLIGKAIDTYKQSKKGMIAAFEYYDWVFANPKKYGILTENDWGELIMSYAGYAWRSMDVKRMENALRIAKEHGKNSIDTGLFTYLYDVYTRRLPEFPKADKEKTIPTDPSTFLGVDVNKKVVHAKDFGWNPTNATACIQAAVNVTNATMIVIDKMPGPWYVNCVTLTKQLASNRMLLFKKGVTVLSAPESQDKKSPAYYRQAMFEVKGTNIWIEAEGQVGKDVYIGKYRNRKERLESGCDYGGDGVHGGGAQRLVIKNLWLVNNTMDGFSGGFSYSYAIDCIFDDNYRQGMSLGGGSENVFKNCVFCNNFGAEPHCGIDFEPYYEVYSCPFQYFYDCKFHNNASKNIIFATSTYAPMCALFKRCDFEAQRNGNICISTRIGIYLEALCHAPSNIIFDECRIDGYSDGWANPIQFNASMLYDVTFRNCVINDKGKFGRDGDHKASPIKLTLDRAVWDGYYPYPGIVTFDNVTINGYEGVPLVEIEDRNGKYCINSFRGSVIRNGKKESLDSFDYQPPERKLQEAPEANLAKLNPAEGSSTVWTPAFDFGFGGSWYHEMSRYTMFASGKKGEKATFTVQFNAVSHPGDAIVVTRPDGQKEDVFQPKPGVNTFSYVFPADGVYGFDMNIAQDLAHPDTPKDGFRVLAVKGTHPAWQACKVDLGRAFKMELGDDYPAYTGYFEMPANKTCAIRIQNGGLEIRNAEGKLVKRVTPDDYNVSLCFTVESKQNEIWSFRTIGKRLNFKFCDPMPAIFADDPAWLPTYGKDLAYNRRKRAGASLAEMPKAVLFPLPISGAIAKAVDAEAAKRAAFGATNDVVKAYKKASYHYRWMEPAMQRPAELAMMDAELAALEPLRKQRDMQVAAKRESADLRRYVAFVSLYAPLLALDDTAAKAWVEKWSGGKVEKCDEEDEALSEATNAAINPYGVEWLDEGLYYEDYMGIVKLAPFIANRLKTLGF